MKNSNWTRDEVLIAFDFYISNYPNIPSKHSKEIRVLSSLLRQLRVKLDGEIPSDYRNLNGVHMKMMNFDAINPYYEKEGLNKVSKLDKEIFREYWDKPKELRSIVVLIKSVIQLDEKIINFDEEDDIHVAVLEGRILTRLHRTRERDNKIIKRKKEKVHDEQGLLECEACSFDFEKKYSTHGKGFIECHHNKPVSLMLPGEKTKLDDLSLVCSNCHRMIHRSRPWITIEQLRCLWS